ncbi:MAG: selenide, water dikinase SelD [Eubacterium aggregans]|uniref:Selenide, water dikinase n=1 Tax=Eubacterium aggregans TaxID=81409 RepID=A0A1H3YPP1_9FIRM|nr:selenide, water dikinase SelD [Eubacterium aggregans]MDD4691523.1 selenide, water dikinase SelD [Eubacterium aggregans]MEA5073588.1 selenide, water dikinase SelD [Eubacterium aggregans]SEA13539.1 selenophosphate synthase [Eubacterium aggregans]
MEETIKLTKLAKCAGCGAKVGAGTLSELLGDLKVHQDDNLIVGFDKSDDASVYKISDELALVQTLDFFPPIADDPYLFGQIAATNALSDVYAMGGEPKLAMNILCVTESMPREAVHEVLRGGYDKVYEAGAIITGGHSIIDEEPKYGLSVTGFVHPDKVLSNSGAKVGDQLILTKPLGVGILTTGAKVDMVEPENLDRVMTQMTTLNKAARDVMVKYRVHSCTDVTGFSLMGHGYEMAEGSDASLAIWMDSIKVLPQALELAEMGILPAGMYRNRSFCEGEVAVDEGISRAMVDVLFDPQTSGGLLMAVDPEDAEALYRELQGQVPGAQWIGEVRDAIPGCKIKIHPCR